jgi:hypothetical protein
MRLRLQHVPSITQASAGLFFFIFFIAFVIKYLKIKNIGCVGFIANNPLSARYEIGIYLNVDPFFSFVVLS